MAAKGDDWDHKTEDQIRDEGPGERFSDTPPQSRLLTPLADALKKRRIASWLVKKVMLKGYVYALTAMTNAGKTAIAIHLALLVGGRGGPLPLLGPHKVKRGRVAYFILENDQDILNRFHAAIIHQGIEDVSNIHVLTHINLKEDVERLKAEAERHGDFNLVIIDTSSVAFASSGGKAEDDNVEMTTWAEVQRQLTKLPGHPTVLALCHPIKRPESQEQLLPRGGSGYNNTIDGNLTIWRTDDGTLDFHHLKIRGGGFEPIQFGLEEVEDESFKDDDGDMTPYLVAVERSELDQASAARRGKETEDRILTALVELGALRQNEICLRTGLDKTTVSRAIKRMVKLKLVASARVEGEWQVTNAGKAAVGATE